MIDVAKNSKELLSQIKDLTIAACNSDGGLAEQIKDVIQYQIEEDVYETYSPKVYNRTMGLQNSVVKKNTVVSKGSITAKAGHDTSLINAYSVIDNRDVSAFLPFIVQEGAYDLWRTKDVYTKERNYMKNAENIILMEKEKMLKSALIKQGVNVV